MGSFVTKALGDKKERRSMEAPADALPGDCRVRDGEIRRTGVY
jgi:hypothetical protein